MRDFIKENLRIQLENLLYEYHENFNEMPDSIRYTPTRVRSKEQLIKLSELAKELNDKYSHIFGGINDGDGTYPFKITKSGNGFLIVHDNGKDDRSYRLGQEGKVLRLNAMAYGSQGDNSDKTVFFPIADAKIKLLADDESIKNIMDFDFEGSYTSNDQLPKNKELADTNTPEDRAYLKDKFIDAERRKQNKGIVSIDGPDYTKNPAYVRLSTQLKNKLELSKKLDNPALTQDIATLKDEIEKIKANHAE
jgi:hypothetical protein